MLGDPAVGKTALIRRFVLDKFDDKYIQTLGTKVSVKSLVVPAEPGSPLVQLDLVVWDVMGQRGFLELLAHAYYYGSQGLLAVADGTRPDTLNHLPKDVDLAFGVTGMLPVVLAVNKVDLKDAWKTTREEAEQIAAKLGARLFYTSARTGSGVGACFDELVREVVRSQFPYLLKAPAPGTF